MLDPIHQRIIDDEHLRLLRICYFIMAGTAAFAILFGLMYVVMGIFFAAAFNSVPHPSAANAPPAFMGFMFAAMGGFIVLFAGGYAALCFLTARALGRRRSRTLCLVTAGASCLSIPFGTALGIFTFTVLGRPSVEALFESRGAPPLQRTIGAPPPPQGTVE